jgi:hypothetical protein
MDISPSGRQLVFADSKGGNISLMNSDGTNLLQMNGLQSASW